jgi:NMD protein affecting ribosome stability and mRNA decay
MSESRQRIGWPRAHYDLVDPPDIEPEVCRHCGGDIVQVGARWYALEARWPNLAHCHYSARNGESEGHDLTESQE